MCSRALCLTLGFLLFASPGLAEPGAGAPEPEEQPSISTEPEQSPPRDFSIIYEGNTGGVSGATAELWMDPTIAAALPTAGQWKRHSVGFGAFLSQNSWLVQADGNVRAFLERTEAGLQGPGAQAQELPTLIGDDYAVVAWPPAAAEQLIPQLAEALGHDPLRPPPKVETRFGAALGATTGKSPGLTLLVRPNADDEVIVSAAEDWELRLRSVYRGLSVDGVPTQLFVIARLPGEGSRRSLLAQTWQDKHSLYLSAGEAIEGRSFLAGRAISLQRPVTWETWRNDGLDALAPGAAELLVGIDELRQEAATHGVALVSANLLDSKGAALFQRWKQVTIKGQRVVLIGWSDPSLVHRLPPELRAEIRLGGPRALLDVLASLPTEPDTRPNLVVLFGVGARSLAGHLPGVDLVLGDFTADLHLPRWEEVGEAALRARSRQDRRATSPALVTRSGPEFLGRVDISFDPDQGVLRRLGHLRAHIGEELPTDPNRRARIGSIRQQIYAGLEQVLLPDLTQILAEDEATSLSLDERRFAQLAGNLLIDRSGSDLAILRPLPSSPEISGAAQELFIEAALAVNDKIVVLELSGAQLWQIAQSLALIPSEQTEPAPQVQEAGPWAWSAGLKVNGQKLWVRGRLLGKDERVRVATTDFIANDSSISKLLKKSKRWEHFQARGWRRQASSAEQGEAWLLRELVGGGLKQLRQWDPSFGERYQRRLQPLLRDQRRISPRLLLELDGIALQIAGSVPAGDRSGYESSRESRVHQQSSLSASLRGRIAGTWDDRRGSITAFLSAAFGRSKLPDVSDPVELEDDLLLGIEGRLKVIQLPEELRNIRLSAFAQSAFDSEFAPALDESGSPLPRQQLWRTTAGASLGKHLWFKEVKFGFFLEYDFAAEVGPLSPGFSTLLRVEKRWGPVRWSALGDLKGYLPTESDTAEDLLFTLQIRNEVSVIPLGKLLPGLSIGGYIDTMFFRGKTEATSTPGMHLLIGAALSYDRDLRAALPLR